MSVASRPSGTIGDEYRRKKPGERELLRAGEIRTALVGLSEREGSKGVLGELTAAMERSDAEVIEAALIDRPGLELYDFGLPRELLDELTGQWSERRNRAG